MRRGLGVSGGALPPGPRLRHKEVELFIPTILLVLGCAVASGVGVKWALHPPAEERATGRILGSVVVLACGSMGLVNLLRLLGAIR